MLLITESVQALSGRAFRRIIRIFTDGRLKSVGGGMLMTAVMQAGAAGIIVSPLRILAFVFPLYADIFKNGSARISAKPARSGKILKAYLFWIS